VIVGHNRRIAWGFTNVGPTVEDLYVENFNGQNAYQTPAGWQPPQHRAEVIHVKGQPDVTLDVVVTRHGPIITDLIPGETRKMAMHWTIYDSLHNPFFRRRLRQQLGRVPESARDLGFARAERRLRRRRRPHRLPCHRARADPQSGDGSLPVSGADDAHEWTGYIPFDKLPMSTTHPREFSPPPTPVSRPTSIPTA